SERLAEAGRIMSEQPATLQLRFLQTLSEVATEKNSTIVFPVPVDLINLLTTGMREAAAGGGGDGARPRIRVNGGGDAQQATATHFSGVDGVRPLSSSSSRRAPSSTVSPGSTAPPGRYQPPVASPPARFKTRISPSRSAKTAVESANSAMGGAMSLSGMADY